MKSKIILLFIISLLLQCCTTYTTINEQNTAFQKGKFYKIKQNKKYTKGLVTNFNEEIVTITHNNKEKNINKNAIEKVKIRKTSVGNTIVLASVIFLIVIPTIAYIIP